MPTFIQELEVCNLMIEQHTIEKFKESLGVTHPYKEKHLFEDDSADIDDVSSDDSLHQSLVNDNEDSDTIESEDRWIKSGHSIQRKTHDWNTIQRDNHLHPRPANRNNFE